MIKIEGTYNTAIVYADTIEAGAEGQIQKLVSQEFNQRQPYSHYARCTRRQRLYHWNDYDHYG